MLLIISVSARFLPILDKIINSFNFIYSYCWVLCFIFSYMHFCNLAHVGPKLMVKIVWDLGSKWSNALDTAQMSCNDMGNFQKKEYIKWLDTITGPYVCDLITALFYSKLVYQICTYIDIYICMHNIKPNLCTCIDDDISYPMCISRIHIYLPEEY